MKNNYALMLRNIRLFAAAMRSSDSVNCAFQSQPLLRCWWNCVLALHRKSVSIPLSEEAYWFCVADGFRFYGWLYRILAVLLLGMLTVLWKFGLAGSFWLCLLGSAALYLWVTTGLAFEGAKVVVENAHQGVERLVCFLCFISVFLAAILTAICLFLHTSQLISDTVNLALTGILVAFGAGSYLIELIALGSAKTEPYQR